MKILFASDLHGCQLKYQQLYEAAMMHGADIVVNGGDMYPKQGDRYQQEMFVADELPKHFGKFQDAGINYLCYPGNDDLMVFDDMFDSLCASYSLVHNIAQRKVDIGGIDYIGMNWVPDYPFRFKDRCRMDTKEFAFEEQYGTALFSSPDGFVEKAGWFEHVKGLPTIKDELNALVRPDCFGKSIYVIHTPPGKMKLDVCHSGREVGSNAVHDFIKKYQPMLSLHGHIHESPQMSGQWKAELGKTICVQPGQSMDLVYVTIDLGLMSIQRHSSAISPKGV